MKVSEIFEQEPMQWGLRGDPYLWREMTDRLRDVEMPSRREELKALIERAYEESTGRTLRDEEPFVVERFKHGGMSSGWVSPEFWITRGIPLLVGRRFQAHEAPHGGFVSEF